MLAFVVWIFVCCLNCDLFCLFGAGCGRGCFCLEFVGGFWFCGDVFVGGYLLGCVYVVFYCITLIVGVWLGLRFVALLGCLLVVC